MNLTLETITSLLSLIFGGTGIAAFIGARKERKAQAELAGASALIEMQKSYTQYVIDNNAVVNELRTEIKNVSLELKKYKDQCKVCSNNKL